jgi:hypothetical protein
MVNASVSAPIFSVPAPMSSYCHMCGTREFSFDDLRGTLAVCSFDSDDQLAGERIYYDRAKAFAQLGVFREPVSWFGRIALVLNHPRATNDRNRD